MLGEQCSQRIALNHRSQCQRAGWEPRRQARDADFRSVDPRARVNAKGRRGAANEGVSCTRRNPHHRPSAAAITDPEWTGLTDILVMVFTDTWSVKTPVNIEVLSDTGLL